ncbi:MAG: TIGR03663 family protein [Chloroflexota bacterium]|nr:TIGR03663 family protein [Chloroflexota bacterium]
MASIEQEIEIRESTWRDISLPRYLALNWPVVLLGVMVLLAVGSRFWELGRMALHHDESLHALYSFYNYDRGGYTHDPLMHGPLLFHLVALGYWLFGVSDATARLLPAILGVFLVWVPWKFRDWLGMKGALVASALILISPTLLYYSRFIRHDVFLAAWTVIIVYGMWKYLQDGEDFHLYLMTAGWALAYSEKEVSYLLTMVFWTFLAVVVALRYTGRLGPKVAVETMREWHLLILIGALALPHTAALFLHAAGMDPAGGYTAAAYRNPAFLMQAGAVVLLLFSIGALVASALWNGRKFLIAAGIFYAIFILLHTNFLTWPWGIGSGMVGSLGYWIDQHGVERGAQPWYYYTLLTPLYEFLPLLIGVIGGGILLARGRNARVAPRPSDEEKHLNSQALWPYFNLWWVALTFLSLSLAGEKMPWLLVHIALPLAFLGGWAMDRFLERVEWEALRVPVALAFAGLVTVAFFSAVTLLWMALGGEWPFRGTDMEALALTTRWLGAALFLIAASWGIVKLRHRLEGEMAGQLAIVVVTVILALATVRFAFIAAFRNADLPNEPLIYTQTSPDVPMVVREIETISERMTGGKELKIAYDSGATWPFEWYLRDYPNRFLFGSSPESYTEEIRSAPVVIASQDTNRQVEMIVGDYIKHHYSMRPNFPEDYKKLMDVVELQPDPSNPEQVNRVVVGQSRGALTILDNLLYYIQQPQARADFLHFLWNREIRNPLGIYDFYVYVKPEVAAEVWQYGLTVATMDPELTRDPYFEAMVSMEATTTLTSGMHQPKDLSALPDGTLVVADSGNHRILILEPDGEVVSEFGSFGTEPGQFNEPWGVAVAPDGTIYVADTWNHRIQHLDQEGNVLHLWGRNVDTGGPLTDPGLFYGPRDITVDEDGNVYVTDTGNKRVQVFDPEGNFLEQFGGTGVEAGQLAEPVGIDIAPDGTIYVADTWNQRIQAFSPEYEPIQQIPVRAWEGQNITNKPYIEATDDRLWITDPEAARIIEMDREGEILRVWGQFGTDAISLNLPFGLTLEDGTLWVADSENQRVLGYNVEQ